MDSTYTLKLSPQQAKTVIAALDLYSRVGMGQLEEIAQLYRFDERLNANPDKIADLDYVQDLMKKAKFILLGLAPNTHCGICGITLPKHYRVAFDIEYVLRQKVALTENHETFSVWRQDPLHVARDVPLAECEAR